MVGALSSRPTMRRPPITCHVLDTVTGQPAAGIPVRLALVSPADGDAGPITATTNADGRVSAWDSPAGARDVHEVFAAARVAARAGAGDVVWELRFDVGDYFRGEGFWTTVDVRFKTDVAGDEGRSHWHVPLLLSPWSYTTYRGS